MAGRTANPSSDSVPDLTNLLARAGEIAPKLGSATDELNAAIGRAEQAIASMKLGVSASVTLTEDSEQSYDRLELLTFQKEGASWRLLVERGIAGEPESWSSTPLVNASRETRLLAADRLPELIAKLITEAESHVELVRLQAAMYDSVASSIKSRGGAK
jgi:hypothetical protein